ncbi:unnamed protein product [Darwinula stevensoni]|uniref:Palmitoyltransferase n=1 Tax=Darwinula stevensoni TaxID=69355 RepID=A0A7R8WZ39_9CRUS|nr:unnamed protein product [Darwinula stevensoni]CAG0880125.1 unnamed protein product [Darwinula stevensoni]
MPKELPTVLISLDDEDPQFAVVEKFETQWRHRKNVYRPWWMRVPFFFILRFAAPASFFSVIYIYNKFGMMLYRYFDSDSVIMFWLVFYDFEIISNWIQLQRDRSNVNENFPILKALPQQCLKSQCHVCHISRPLRVHHCPICDYCVWRRDHHCFLLGLCIGQFNHANFIFIMVYTTLASITYMYYCIQFMRIEYPFSGWYYLLCFALYGLTVSDVVTSTQFTVLVVFNMALFMAVALALFAAFHVYLVKTNDTMQDFAFWLSMKHFQKMDPYKYLPQPPLFQKMIFGPSPILRFFFPFWAPKIHEYFTFEKII